MREVTEWLAAREAGREVLVVGGSNDTAGEHIRAVALRCGSAFGMHRFTLARLAAELAKLELVEQDLATVGGLPIEALCARVVQRMRRDGTLGRLEAVSTQPGLPRALARTLLELRMAGARDELTGELAAGLRGLELELAGAKLADRALVFQLATAVAADRARRGLLLGLDIVLIDVAVHSLVEQQLVAALTARAPEALASVPHGDARSIERISEALGVTAEVLTHPSTGSLARVQRDLFAPVRETAALDDSIEIFSAPGESRECVEIARRVLHAAERGIPFDRMAVLLRSPESYRVHLEEALSRANIPVHFDQGTRLPDPTGRAFLALLACASEELSAKRFAEYISIGEVPLLDVPPAPLPSADRWVPPEEELLPIALASGDEDLGEVMVVRGVEGGEERTLGAVFAP
jgi:ATP-dependent helicase/nuclease subunit B